MHLTAPFFPYFALLRNRKIFNQVFSTGIFKNGASLFFFLSHPQVPSLLTQAAIAGFGIALIPRCLVLDELHDGRLETAVTVHRTSARGTRLLPVLSGITGKHARAESLPGLAADCRENLTQARRQKHYTNKAKAPVTNKNTRHTRRASAWCFCAA